MILVDYPCFKCDGTKHEVVASGVVDDTHWYDVVCKNKDCQMQTVVERRVGNEGGRASAVV